jgi:hypothetical protein
MKPQINIKAPGFRKIPCVFEAKLFLKSLYLYVSVVKNHLSKTSKACKRLPSAE